MYRNHSKTNWTILKRNLQNIYTEFLVKKSDLNPNRPKSSESDRIWIRIHKNCKLRDRRNHSHLEDKDQISDEFLL